MISQLLNDAYIEIDSIDKKEWKKHRPDLEWEDSIWSILIGQLEFHIVFYYKDTLIDTNEKVISLLKNVNLDSLEKYILIELFYMYQASDREGPEFINQDEFGEMTLFEKCEYLQIEWYLADRNIQKLANYGKEQYKYKIY